MSPVYTARPRSQASLAASVALDFGLRIRVDGDAPQRTLFSGAESLSLQELCSELGLMISELRVRSFSLRHQLEQVTDALLVNVRCGFWLAGSPRRGRSRRSSDVGPEASLGRCRAVCPRFELRLPHRRAVREGGALMGAHDGNGGFGRRCRFCGACGALPGER